MKTEEQIARETLEKWDVWMDFHGVFTALVAAGIAAERARWESAGAIQPLTEARKCGYRAALEEAKGEAFVIRNPCGEDGDVVLVDTLDALIERGPK